MIDAAEADGVLLSGAGCALAGWSSQDPGHGGKYGSIAYTGVVDDCSWRSPRTSEVLNQLCVIEQQSDGRPCSVGGTSNHIPGLAIDFHCAGCSAWLNQQADDGWKDRNHIPSTRRHCVRKSECFGWIWYGPADAVHWSRNGR
jgi:hypothetical protein